MLFMLHHTQIPMAALRADFPWIQPCFSLGMSFLGGSSPPCAQLYDTSTDCKPISVQLGGLDPAGGAWATSGLNWALSLVSRFSPFPQLSDMANGLRPVLPTLPFASGGDFLGSTEK